MRRKRRHFLVRIYEDQRIREAVRKPMKIVELDERGRVVSIEAIEKTAILCDSCSSELAVDGDGLEEGLPVGYAVCDEEYVLEVVCEDCRLRFFPSLEVFDDLEEALGGG